MYFCSELFSQYFYYIFKTELLWEVFENAVYCSCAKNAKFEHMDASYRGVITW